jgi:hypothetical protein
MQPPTALILVPAQSIAGFKREPIVAGETGLQRLAALKAATDDYMQWQAKQGVKR